MCNAFEIKVKMEVDDLEYQMDLQQLQDTFTIQIDEIHEVVTSDHSRLINRNLPDQHKISAITGLSDILERYNLELGKKPNIYIDTIEHWDEMTTYIPEKGDLIVYQLNGGNINLKIGDGMAYLIDLPFIDNGVVEILTHHIADDLLHVSEEDRIFWNNKVRCYIDGEDSENIIFTTN